MELERFILFPIVNQRLYDMYLQAVASFWTVGEVDLARDKDDWQKMTDDERHFILTVLSFFATSDRVVNENLAKNFSCEVPYPEAKQFYDMQIGMEAIHTQMYGELIFSYEADARKRNALFRAIVGHPSIEAKANWALRYMDPSIAFEQRLIAFACVEGIFFSASFCAIFYFKKRGLLPGLAFSNELISRDEGLHRDFACLLYRTMYAKQDDAAVHQIVRDAVAVEQAFVRDALPVHIIGMNKDLMAQYVEYVADHLLVSLGHTRLFHAANPFEWMDLISLSGKTNFFEKRVGEYQKAGVVDGQRDCQFHLEDDF
jgi:ribonucleotide reductase beta subunit family protein with ferritin-like domain